jgi:hypothetical protein
MVKFVFGTQGPIGLPRVSGVFGDAKVGSVGDMVGYSGLVSAWRMDGRTAGWPRGPCNRLETVPTQVSRGHGQGGHSSVSGREACSQSGMNSAH